MLDSATDMAIALIPLCILFFIIGMIISVIARLYTRTNTVDETDFDIVLKENIRVAKELEEKSIIENNASSVLENDKTNCL